MKITQRSAMLFAFVAGAIPALGAGVVPLDLPRPDGKPGNPTKPVQVYILAGQSNMVGMGDIKGARPQYPSIYLSADPAILPGLMPIGDSALAAHGIYQSQDPDAPRGATVAIYAGALDPDTDVTSLKPVKMADVALGTVAATLPSIDGPHLPVVSAWIDVPATGTYTVHAGFGDSTHAVVKVGGNEVYRKQPGGKPVVTPIALEQGKRHPVTIAYYKGGSAAFWLQQVGLQGRGDLVFLTGQEKKFQYLVDDEGQWTVRPDVLRKEVRLKPDSPCGPLMVTSNGGSIGPELGFGHVMGTYHDEVVLIIKSAQGNRSLGFDFRPPSSGRNEPDSQWEGLEYRLMVEGVRKTLDNIATIVPDYQGQGYEIAGFGWFQGHKDGGASKEEYEKHLIHLIQDLRKEFNAPTMSAVVATVGFGGYNLSEKYKPIWAAQMAVGDPGQHPELAANVASVDTRDFWREIEESPRSQDYHYHRNPETYLLVGEAMGRAMVRLRGGEAAAIPKSDRESRTAARLAAEAAKPVPTQEQKAASIAAAKPMVLDGALPAFLADPRNQPPLQLALRGEKPAKPSPYLADTLDEAVRFFQAVGIRDYNWTSFGPDMTDATWDYFGFDLPPTHDKSKGISDLSMTAPPTMANWFSPEFDPAKAGWKQGVAPFGAETDPAAFAIPDWYQGSPRAPAKTYVNHDVVLLRRTFDLPPLKEGHRYRIRVRGSVRHNCGDGFAVYVNGTLLAESKSGVTAWRREGAIPRGGHIWDDVRDEFKDGKPTIAVVHFPMNNWPDGGFIPARDPLSVWIEEQKLPPVGE